MTKPTRSQPATSSNNKQKERVPVVIQTQEIQSEEEQQEIQEEFQEEQEDQEEDQEENQPEQNMEEQFANNFGNLLTGLNALVNAMGQGNRETRYAKIADFYGDIQDPIGWLQDFENACQANAITDNRKIQIVGAYLKGAAATWLANKRIIANWPTQWNPVDNTANSQNASFTYQFKLQFRTQDRVYEWQRQLKERKQLPGESVEQYAAAIRELLR